MRLPFALASATVLLGLALPLPAAQAQQTSTLSSLFLSNGSELDFNLYGVNGGAGTNGTNSDRLNVTNQFNFSSASPGNYIVGFSQVSTDTLTPGTIFTLVNFGSTNFTSADAIRFTAQPEGSLSTISGSFILNTLNGGAGTLQFQLSSAGILPEPPTGILMLIPMLGGMAIGWGRERRRKVRLAKTSGQEPREASRRGLLPN